jgi:single-stranded DNA-binding protein
VSLYLLATGALIADPQSRDGPKGPFTTATIRVAGDDPVLVSSIAFGDAAERLLEFAKGDAISVSGRARLTSWTGRDGAEKHGLSLVVEQLAALKPHPRPTARAARAPQRARNPHSSHRPARDSGLAVAADHVDDLWLEPAL